MIKAILLTIYILGCVAALGCTLSYMWKGEDDFTEIFLGLILSLFSSVFSWVTVMCHVIAKVKRIKKQ